MTKVPLAIQILCTKKTAESKKFILHFEFSQESSFRNYELFYLEKETLHR